MLDVSYIPYNQQNTQTFYCSRVSGSADTLGWQTWQKPRSVKMIIITCIGAGAGGGGGSVSNLAGGAGTYGNGGAGGGGGAITKAIYPAFLLPDILYVRPGAGGPGSTVATTNANNRGSRGEDTYVSISPNITSSICVAFGGESGTSAGGAGGSALTSISSFPFMSLGIWKSVDGQDGAAGGTCPSTTATPTVGSDAPVVITTSFTGGGAGSGARNGGTTAAGGKSYLIAPYHLTSNLNVTRSAITMSPSTGSITNPLLHSQPGIYVQSPFFISCGGAGSNSTNNVTGSAGSFRSGEGAYGSGGGGGTTGHVVVGGLGRNIVINGGKGGDGLVFITTIL